MESNHISAWLPDSPSCSPARRWLRALYLVERSQTAKPGFDDDEIQRVIRFLGAGVNNLERSSKAQNTDPALAEAWQLFRAEPPHRKWRLEAYLLTTESLNTVAACCSVSLATVQTYHDVFFDVRPHRKAQDWIELQAIRAGAWNYFAQDFPGSLWKSFAYAAGPLALELAVAVTTDAPLPQWLRESFRRDPVYEEASLRLLGKFAVAALTTDSATEWAKLVEARRQFRGLQGHTPNKRNETNGMAAAMEDFLQWVGGRTKQKHKKAVEKQTPGKRTFQPGGKRKVNQSLSIASLQNLMALSHVAV